MRCAGDRANVDDIYTCVIDLDVHYLVAAFQVEVSSNPLDHHQTVLFVHGVSHAWEMHSFLNHWQLYH